MTLKNLSANVEINADDIIEGILNDMGIDEVADFVKELNERLDDFDFMNDMYEYFKEQHENYLETEGITEKAYQAHYDNGEFYPDDETEDEDDDESWTTEDDDKFFTTD